MKKLLGSLCILGLAASTSIGVVSCEYKTKALSFYFSNSSFEPGDDIVTETYKEIKIENFSGYREFAAKSSDETILSIEMLVDADGVETGTIRLKGLKIGKVTVTFSAKGANNYVFETNVVSGIISIGEEDLSKAETMKIGSELVSGTSSIVNGDSGLSNVSIKSSDETILTASLNSESENYYLNLNPLKIGKASITISADGATDYVFETTVTDKDVIFLDNYSIILAGINQSRDVYFLNGSEIDLDAITISSENEKIAKASILIVTSHVSITSIGEGTTTITLNSKNSFAPVTIEVTVYSV